MKFLNGYKTYIGLALYTLGMIFELLGEAEARQIKEVGLVLSAVGATHKMAKMENVK